MRMGDQHIANKIKNKTVLDLGSGIKSIQFLIDSKAKKIFAVSYDEKELNEIKDNFPKEKNIEYLNLDVTKRFELPEKVDVIIAALFFSALEGSRPKSSLTVLKKIKEYLRPEGILYIEDFYWEENLPEEEDKFGMELEEIRNKVRDKAKVTYPKQLPEKIIIENLTKENFKINNISYKHDNKVWTEHKKKSIESQFKSIKKHSEKIVDYNVKEKLLKRAEFLYKSLRTMENSPAYSYLYLIEAVAEYLDNKKTAQGE